MPTNNNVSKESVTPDMIESLDIDFKTFFTRFSPEVALGLQGMVMRRIIFDIANGALNAQELCKEFENLITGVQQFELLGSGSTKSSRLLPYQPYVFDGEKKK